MSGSAAEPRTTPADAIGAPGQLTRGAGDISKPGIAAGPESTEGGMSLGAHPVEPDDATPAGAQPRRDVSYASAYFNVTPRRIYEWVESGQLACFKLGHRTLRFSDAQLERFANEREVAS